MRRKHLFLAGLTLLLAVSGAQGQSVGKILDAHLKAMGGTNQLRKIQSVKFMGTVASPATGQTGTFTLLRERPDRILTQIDLAGLVSAIGYNGRSAWRRDSRDGLHTITGAEAVRLKAEAAYRNGRSLNYKAEKTRAILAGQAQVNGRSTFKIELTSLQGAKQVIYLDAQTYRLVREEIAADDGPELTDYDDYRPVDGVLEPYSIALRHGDSVLQLAVAQVEHNRPLNESAFAFPRLSNEPLPDIAGLLRSVEANQKNIDQILENYTYNRAVTMRVVNNKGELEDNESSTSEVYYHLGKPIHKAISKNGKPLTASEEEKENKRIEKAIHEIEDQKRKDDEHKAKQEAARARGEPADDQVEPGLSRFLQLCEFVSPRREQFRGRPVIVFDFQPKPGIKARGISETLIQKLVGVIWVDEQAKEVARMEARLNDKMKVGGGLLATLRSGGAVVFEQARINDEIWLPSYTEFNLSARLLLFMGINLNQVERFSNYQKFNAEQTKTVIKDPPKDPAKP